MDIDMRTVHTIIGVVLLLILFFTFFSITFKINFGGTDGNACNKRDPSLNPYKTFQNQTAKLKYAFGKYTGTGGDD
jgi:ABC-type cobalt transport system substrate-binding protein